MPTARQFRDSVAYLRRAAWHLRTGGLSQLRAFTTRHHTLSGADARPTVSTTSPLAALLSRSNTASVTLDFPPAQQEGLRPAPFGDITVAVILDDFSALAWGHEFTTVELTAGNWHKELAGGVDMLLVESAWAGKNGSWRHKLTGSQAPAEELTALVTYCRQRGIPTVFWNKEDPPHFEDFLATAALFDTVFTSDSRKVAEYRKRLGHSRVGVLPFAAQTAIHNPVRPAHGFHERDVAFAGMYFAHKYPERRQQMDLLLGAAHRAFPTPAPGRGLEIFSRFLGDNPNYQFPKPLAEHVVGSLPYTKMLTAYKAYKVFLNVNSVTDSPSMCARRIFEITASGTPVVTTDSAAIAHYFSPDEVPVVTGDRQAQNTIRALVLSDQLNDRTVHLAQRKIWGNHTYTHRAVSLLDSAGVSTRHGSPGDRLTLPSVSVLAASNRPGQLNHLLDTVAGFTGVDAELVLLTHGYEAPAGLADRVAQTGLEVRLLSAPAQMPLGRCLNLLVNNASGQVLAKVDDDDLYGPHYLLDMLYALRYSGAEVVGKQAHYMHLNSSGATILRSPEREHRWTDFVAGPTLTGAREVFIAHPFEPLARGEDTAFLRAVSAGGGRIYSCDRFNFMQVRSGNPAAHAWDISDGELLAASPVKFFGRGSEQVMF